jgi:hypothetical protein
VQENWKNAKSKPYPIQERPTKRAMDWIPRHPSTLMGNDFISIKRPGNAVVLFTPQAHNSLFYF